MEDVPEEERDRGEECESCSDGLIHAIVVQDLGGFVQDITTREEDHQPGEEGTEGEAKKDARDDEDERGDHPDAQKGLQERKVLLGEEDDSGQATKDRHRSVGRHGDDLGSAFEHREVEQRDKKDSLRQNVETETQILLLQGNGRSRPFFGDEADPNKACEDQEPVVATEHRDREAFDIDEFKDQKLEADQSHNRTKEVRVSFA